MASVTVTVAPFGLVFSRNRRASSPTFQANRYKIKAGYASKIAMGDLVATGTGATAGYVTIAPNTPANLLGVFAGVLPYYDQNFQQTVFGLNGSYPGSAANPSTDLDCLVIDDPDAIFRAQIQGGPWVQAWRGLNVGFVAGTNGAPGVSGISTLLLDGTTVSANAALPFRIQEFLAVQPGGLGVGAGLGIEEGGGAGDTAVTNPWVEITLNFGISEQQQAAGQ